MSDFDYDPFTGFVCATFKRHLQQDNVPTVACFDTTKYNPYSPDVVFSAFPSVTDNLRPDEMPTEEEAQTLGRSSLLLEDDDSEDLFEKSPTKLHLHRLLGRSSRSKPVVSSPRVVSDEETVLVVETDQSLTQLLAEPPTAENATETDQETTPDPIPVHRKPYNFISVSKIHFDDCGRMWFFDCGTAYGADHEHDKFYRRPILWSFQLIATEDRKLLNKLFLRYELTTNITHNGISDFVIDIHGSKCEDFHVYMANHLDSNIVVYSHKKGIDYVVADETLTPVKGETKHQFQGIEYPLESGVFSMSLAELNEYGYRDVFFTLGSGNGQYAVNSKTLRRKTNNRYFHSLGYRGCAVNSLNHVYDSYSKVMFYMHPETHSVRCWNTNRRLTPDNVGTVFVDEKLKTGWSIKIDQTNNLWFMANDFNFFTDKKVEEGDVDALNLYRVKVKDVIKGTVCDTGLLLKDEAGEEEDEESSTFDQFIDGILEGLLGESSESTITPPVSTTPVKKDDIME